MFCKFIEIVFCKVYAAFFAFLDLLEQGSIFFVHLVIDFIEFGDAVFIILLCNNQFILAVNARIHSLLHEVLFAFALLLVEEGSLNHNFMLFTSHIAILKLKLAFIVFDALLMQIMQHLLCLFKIIIILI